MLTVVPLSLDAEKEDATGLGQDASPPIDSGPSCAYAARVKQAWLT